MPYVFISYSHQDGTEYADELHEMLKAQDLNPWRDNRSLIGSYEWSVSIDEALADSYAMIVIGTKHAMGSKKDNIKGSIGVTYEWAKALGMGIPVLPIDVDYVMNEVHQLDKSHRLDYRNPDFRDLLLRDLRRLKDEDGITNVRIPFEADPELKALARQAFDSSLSFEANEQAIKRLADMVNEPLACQILANGLNKREFKIVRLILATIQHSHLEFYQLYVIPKLLEFLLIKDEHIDKRLLDYQNLSSLIFIKSDFPIQETLLNALKSDDYPFRTKQKIFETFWNMYKHDKFTEDAVIYLLTHDDKEYFQLVIKAMRFDLDRFHTANMPDFHEFVANVWNNIIEVINDHDRLIQVYELASLGRQPIYSEIYNQLKDRLGIA